MIAEVLSAVYQHEFEVYPSLYSQPPNGLLNLELFFANTGYIYKHTHTHKHETVDCKLH